MVYASLASVCVMASIHVVTSVMNRIVGVTIMSSDVNRWVYALISFAGVMVVRIVQITVMNQPAVVTLVPLTGCNVTIVVCRQSTFVTAGSTAWMKEMRATVMVPRHQ
jgi:putative effector of murein hydrolase LrgA (UPF0299 family)